MAETGFDYFRRRIPSGLFLPPNDITVVEVWRAVSRHMADWLMVVSAGPENVLYASESVALAGTVVRFHLDVIDGAKDQLHSCLIGCQSWCLFA